MIGRPVSFTLEFLKMFCVAYYRAFSISFNFFENHATLKLQAMNDPQT